MHLVVSLAAVFSIVTGGALCDDTKNGCEGDYAPRRLPMKKKTRKVRLFVRKGILKNTPLSSKIHCYGKNRNGLYLHRYRSNCKSVRFLLRASPKLVRKQGKVYLLSKLKRRGYLGGVRYQNMVLSKYLSLCPCNYPFYSAYKSLIHRVNFAQFKLPTDVEKNPGPSVYVDATETIMLHTVKETL